MDIADPRCKGQPNCQRQEDQDCNDCPDDALLCRVTPPCQTRPQTKQRLLRRRCRCEAVGCCGGCIIPAMRANLRFLCRFERQLHAETGLPVSFRHLLAPLAQFEMVPSATNLPASMTATLVHRRSATSRIWDEKKMVVPVLRSRCNTSRMARLEMTSTPSNGSSRKRTRGAWIRRQRVPFSCACPVNSR